MLRTHARVTKVPVTPRRLPRHPGPGSKRSRGMPSRSGSGAATLYWTRMTATCTCSLTPGGSSWSPRNRRPGPGPHRRRGTAAHYVELGTHGAPVIRATEGSLSIVHESLQDAARRTRYPCRGRYERGPGGPGAAGPHHQRLDPAPAPGGVPATARPAAGGWHRRDARAHEPRRHPSAARAHDEPGRRDLSRHPAAALLRLRGLRKQHEMAGLRFGGKRRPHDVWPRSALRGAGPAGRATPAAAPRPPTSAGSTCR